MVKSWTFLSCFVSWSSSVHLVTGRENVTTARPPPLPALPSNVVSIEAKNRIILCNCCQIMEIDAELVIVR